MRKDSIISGIMAGSIANFIKLIVAWTGQLTGWLDYMFIHFALGLFMPEEYLNDSLAILLGYITDFANSALFGVVLIYIFKVAGKDYALVKGAVYGILIHVIVYGGIIQFNISNIYTVDPLANLVLLLANMVFGITAAWVIERYYHPEEKVG